MATDASDLNLLMVHADDHAPVLADGLDESTARGQRIAGGTLHSLELELQKGTLSKTVDELIAHALATVGDKGTDATRQLMGRAGEAQVPDCNRAFVSGNGGVLSEQEALILVGD